MKCESCGHDNEEGAVYCVKCASNLEKIKNNSVFMKCESCGHDNEEGAVYCVKCGNSIKKTETRFGIKHSSIILILLVILITFLVGYAAFSILDYNEANSQKSVNSDSVKGSGSSEAKSWHLIHTYSGSGSGSKKFQVPAGKIMIKATAYPIKNYGYNHLYVNPPTGDSVSMDWGPKSPVESKYDSVTFSSGGGVVSLDYYELTSFTVEFYRYY